MTLPLRNGACALSSGTSSCVISCCQPVLPSAYAFLYSYILQLQTDKRTLLREREHDQQRVAILSSKLSDVDAIATLRKQNLSEQEQAFCKPQ